MERKFSNHKNRYKDEDFYAKVKVLSDLDYGSSFSVELEKIPLKETLDNQVMRENVQRLKFFDRFFSEENLYNIGRIKLTSPENCAIIAIKRNDNLCYSTELLNVRQLLDDSLWTPARMQSCVRGFRAIFDGDTWGDTLEDYERFLYSKGVTEVCYLKNIPLKDMEAFLKYYLLEECVEGFNSRRINGWRPGEDEVSRKVSALTDKYNHILYWNQAELPTSFNIDFLRMAASQYEKVIAEASNRPEGVDVVQYFVENPMPNFNIVEEKTLALTNDELNKE